MNKLKAIICAALSVCILAVPLASSVVTSAAAEDVQSLQNRIDELNAKSKEYQAILDSTETDINEKQAYGDALVGKISTLNEKVILTREAIADLNTDIEDKKAKIDAGNEGIEDQIDALCERLRLIYMAGSASNLEILLGAKDFGDFIDKLSLVKTLSNYDRELIDEVNSQLTVIEAEKTALEADKADLEAQEASLNADLEELNGLVAENEAVLTELASKSAEARAAISSGQGEAKQLEAQIAEYWAEQAAAAARVSQAQAEEAKKRAAQEQQKAAQEQQQQQQQSSQHEDNDDDYDDSGSGSGSSSGGETSQPDYDDVTPAGGGYTWPCPGYFYLSSLWNEDRYTYNHGAIDIAGGDILGAAVVAADSGTVTDTCSYCTHNWGKSGSCGCGGGYGNYVWIDHGNGKETIYAHLTSLIVSPGQTVSKGQVIGYVGSTGHSTGPHLHFECRYGGVKYNPMNELSAYWGMVSY